MTIDQAIKTVDKLRPSGVSPIIMRTWLSQLDGRIKEELYRGYRGLCDIPFDGYTDETPGNTQLLAPEAYSMIYIYWINYNVDYSYGEGERALADLTLFNNAWRELAGYVAKKYRSVRSNHFVI